MIADSLFYLYWILFFLFFGPRTEKFNIVSNDRGRTQNLDFSVLDPKYPFWASLVQKSKSSFQAEIWYLD